MYSRDKKVFHIFYIAASFILIATAANADDWTPLWTTASLSSPRQLLAATAVGDKILIGGGTLNQQTASNRVDVFDTTNGTWSTATLSQPRCMLAATSSNGKAFFAGGEEAQNVLDIYNSSTNQWSSTQLPHPRDDIGAASAGGKVVFAGGFGGYYSDAVDIYDTATGVWSSATLSVQRDKPSVASLGDKVYIAGGYAYNGQCYDSVEILDTKTGNWSTATLSAARSGMGAASANGKVFFAGGSSENGNSASVDILDVASGTWSSGTLSEARGGLVASALATKVFFAGGYGSLGQSDAVDIYDTATGAWSSAKLSLAREYLATASAGNKVVFAGGQLGADHATTNRVDIYTLQNYNAITSSKTFELVDNTTVSGRMQLNSPASLALGGFNLNVGSMAGAASINLSTHALTAGADNTSSSYSGTITGNGTLVKTGNGVLTLSGSNSYLGLTTVNAGELDLVGPNAWNPIMNSGGAYLTSGKLVFDYTGNEDPYATIMSLLDKKINGSMPLNVVDDTGSYKVTVSLVPEPSTFLLTSTALIGLLIYIGQRRKSKR